MKPTLFIFITIIFLGTLSQTQAIANEHSDNRILGEPLSIQTIMQETQDTLKIHQYGEKIANLFLKSDWPAILDEIHPVNLPEAWEGQVKSFFENYFGHEMAVKIIPVRTLPDYQLKSFYKAPEEILSNSKWAVSLRYDNSTEEEKKNKGHLELVVYDKGKGDYSILLVGG